MGSLAWAQCYWCWKWEYDMYHALCDSCMDCDEPPWYPNNRQRAELYLKNMLNSHRALRVVAAEVAALLADPYEP